VRIDKIRKLKWADPFRPFELIAQTGDVIRIERSSAIALAPNGLSVAGFDPIGKSFYLPLAELSAVRLSRLKRLPRDERR
jgi:hypothetical protein